MRQANAATIQNIRKMSSNAMRLCTSSSPSRASSSPAMVPSRLERVIRRAVRASNSTARLPKTTEANRQAKAPV